MLSKEIGKKDDDFGLKRLKELETEKSKSSIFY
jgi:hypothetical protein